MSSKQRRLARKNERIVTPYGLALEAVAAGVNQKDFIKSRPKDFTKDMMIEAYRRAK